MKKILVTGAAGFIGSNFIFYLLEHHPNYKIVAYDALTYAGNLKTLSNVLKEQNNKLKFIKGDIREREKLAELFETEQFDIVINFAAESHVDRSIEGPDIFFKTNIIGTQVLMDVCRKCHIERYHQVSTDEVYGELPLNRTDLFFDEKSPLLPSSPYSASKASADLLAMAYYKTYDFPVTISRCSNNYGSYQFPEKLIPLMLLNAIEDDPLPIYGTGENVRDWLYVEDHCRAIDLIIQKGTVGEVYNIGGNVEKSNLEVVKMILRELGKPESLIQFVEDRKGHDLRYAINADKIQKELGWEPMVKFPTGIRKTIRWYLENREWWEEILSGRYRAYNDLWNGERL